MTPTILSQFIAEPATPQTNVPNEVIFDDKPEYVKFLLLRAECRNYKEISAITGYSAAHISTVCRQPWFQQKLRDLIALTGQDRILMLYKMELENSFYTLVELRDTSKSDAVRFQSAKELTDRLMGKTVQQTETATVHRKSVEAIDERLEEVEREIEEARGRIMHQTNTQTS